jgi:predicted  nucleic acid-binding Zn-ribbon protein
MQALGNMTAEFTTLTLQSTQLQDRISAASVQAGRASTLRGALSESLRATEDRLEAFRRSFQGQTETKTAEFIGFVEKVSSLAAGIAQGASAMLCTPPDGPCGTD